MERALPGLADLPSPRQEPVNHASRLAPGGLLDPVTEGAANPLRDRGLENIANNSARAGQSPDHHQSLDHRASRWEALGVLWRESGLRRVQTCRRWPITKSGFVEIRAKNGAAGYAGLSTCGSVWACPVCNSKIMASRRFEVGTSLALGLVDGSAAFGAYTVHHHAGSNLDTTWRAMSTLWNAVAVDKSVRTARKDLGHLGLVRAAEVTWSPANGWHPHLHPLHFFAGAVTSADVAALHAAQFRAWRSAAERLGLTAPREVAQRLRLVASEAAEEALADYMAKGVYASADGLGWEMTSTQTKSSTRAKGATPWDLLYAVHHDGDADALALWRVWEKGSRGKRALTWSRGLRKHFGLDAEKTDEQLAAQVVGDAEDAGVELADWGWVRRRPVDGGLALSAWHRGGWPAVRAFLDERRVNYREV